MFLPARLTYYIIHGPPTPHHLLSLRLTPLFALPFWSAACFFFFFFFFQRAALQTALEPRVTLICMCGCWMASITPTTCSRPIPATSDLLHFTYRPEPAALCVPADSPPCVYEHGLKCVVHVNIWSCLLPSEEHAASCLMISLQADSSVSERSRGGGERMLSLHCNHKMNLLFCLRSIIGQKGFMNPFLLMWNLH